MKPDIKFNNDSVEVEGPLTLDQINGPVRVTKGLTLIGLGESPANGFTHLVLKPESLVFETFQHPKGKTSYDVKAKINENEDAVKKVAADVQAINERTRWTTDVLNAVKDVIVGVALDSVPPNTPVQQVVLSPTKILVQTVMQPGGGILPNIPGTTVRPTVISRIDLVEENQSLKEQVAKLEERVTRIERRLALLESKVK